MSGEPVSSVLATDLRELRRRLGCVGFYLVAGVAMVIAVVVITIFALFVTDIARGY